MQSWYCIIQSSRSLCFSGFKTSFPMKASAPAPSSTMPLPPPGLGMSAPKPPPGFTGIPLNSNVVESTPPVVNLWAYLVFLHYMITAWHKGFWLALSVLSVFCLFPGLPKCRAMVTWCQRTSARGTWSWSSPLGSTSTMTNQNSTSSKTTLPSSDRYSLHKS